MNCPPPDRSLRSRHLSCGHAFAFCASSMSTPKGSRVSDGLTVELAELRRGFGAVRRAKLRSGVRDVARDGMRAQREPDADLFVGEASGRQIEDLDLALTQLHRMRARDVLSGRITQ